MSEQRLNQRKTVRYDHESDLNFSYDVKARVAFSVEDTSALKNAAKKYGGLSKNVSVEGLCFTSHLQLHEGEPIVVEVYLPKVRDRISLKGEVRWSRGTEADAGGRVRLFDTGVQLLAINGQPVQETIYFDKQYHVAWSAVLESILGSYRRAVVARKTV